MWGSEKTIFLMDQLLFQRQNIGQGESVVKENHNQFLEQSNNKSNGNSKTIETMFYHSHKKQEETVSCDYAWFY